MILKGFKESRKWKCESGMGRGGPPCFCKSVTGKELGDGGLHKSVRGKELGKKRARTFEGWKVGKSEGEEEMENEGDKGRRCFLRRGERQGKYNAEGTGCQCLFSM